MEKRTCKLCSKTFSNGRALGGHMRSHMTILSPNPTPKPQQLPPTPSLSSSSSEEEGGGGGVGGGGINEAEEAKGLSYGLRENPQKSFRLADPEFSFAVEAASSVVQDRESETESSKHPSRKRSNRPRRQSEQKPELEPEPLSSVSDTTTEEDVARCLMMLSRDIWMRDSSKPSPESEDDEQDIGYDDEEEEDESGHELKFLPRSRSKFQCGTCKKVFRSYQALGGHRASHKKIKLCSTDATLPSTSAARIQEGESDSRSAAAAGRGDDRKIHECPVCFRVFASGQALGGHKRSHISASASGSATAAAASKFGDSLIDLNLPAPVEDDEISQVELSAVSDAEFVDPGN